MPENHKIQNQNTFSWTLTKGHSCQRDELWWRNGMKTTSLSDRTSRGSHILLDNTFDACFKYEKHLYEQHLAPLLTTRRAEAGTRQKGHCLPTTYLCSSSQVTICQVTNEPLKMRFSKACPRSPELTCVRAGSWAVASCWSAVKGRWLAPTCGLDPGGFLTKKCQRLATWKRGHFGERNDLGFLHQHNWKIPKSQSTCS